MIQKNNILMALFSIFVIFLVFQWIDFLTKNKYIVECLQNNYPGVLSTQNNPKNILLVNNATNSTVSLPLTTTSHCDNLCGPTARCSITGQQCTADIDCPGCQPYSPPLPYTNNCVPGNNDAGKLTIGTTPTYSSLTTDIGTQAKLFISNENKLVKPPQANFGVDTWRSTFDEERKLFDNRYKCNNYPFQIDYPTRYSTTGEFIEKEPLASNAYLH